MLACCLSSSHRRKIGIHRLVVDAVANGSVATVEQVSRQFCADLGNALLSPGLPGGAVEHGGTVLSECLVEAEPVVLEGDALDAYSVATLLGVACRELGGNPPR